MRSLVLTGFLLVGVSTALAQQPDANTPPAKTQEQQAGAPDATSKAAPSAETKPEFAYLHVYRARRYVGSALAPTVYVDDKPVARIGNGRRVTIKLSLATHSVRSDDKSSVISLDAKAGQDFFVRIDEQTGFLKGHGKLTLLMPEQGKPEYSLQKAIEPDRKIAKEMIADDADTTSAKDEPKNK